MTHTANAAALEDIAQINPPSHIPGSRQSLRDPSDSELYPELELLTCIARRELDHDNTARAAQLLDRGIDWEILYQRAEAHGLMPLLYWHVSRSLSDRVPPEHSRRLKRSFLANVAHTGLLAQEFVNLLRILRDTNIEAVPFKGLALAEELYGSIALRQCGDLDFLIHKQDLTAAIRALGAVGYKSTLPLSPAQLEAYTRSHNELMFRESKALLDLHWEILPSFFSLSFDSAKYLPNLRRIRVSEIETQSLSPENLLLLLCIHGGKHLWTRLIWLCDVSELIRKYPNLDWKYVLSKAREVGAQRLLLVGLCLSKTLLGTALPETVAKEIKDDPTTRILSAQLRKDVIDGQEPSEISIDLFWLKSRERWSDKIRFLVRYPTTPTFVEFSLVSLPKPLFPLYRVLRVARASRRIASIAGKWLLGNFIAEK